ncbi:MAG: DUF4838 domain-containing protein [Oscillospiraceae bacterium]|nr:DUF4838 domain-containing protein [Oscillospiraceae bacterium]
MGMVQTFFVGILLFFQSILAPLIYDIPAGPVDYGGGFVYEEAAIGEPLYIFENGATEYFLVTPDVPVPTVEEGVKWIQDFIFRMTGETFVRKTASEIGAGDKFIAVGVPSLGGGDFAADIAELKAEGDDFIKRVVDGNVILSGNGNGRGSMYACSSFIEDQLGCRWFTPQLKFAPEKQDVVIDGELDDTQYAQLEYRDDFWAVVNRDANFKAFHKLNTFQGENMGAQYGYCINYIGGFCHTMHDLVPWQAFYGDHIIPHRNNKLVEQDKELFAYRKDIKDRVSGQRCLTNPDVLAMTIEHVLEDVAMHVNAGNIERGYMIASVTQDDNNDYCQCPACEEADAKYGGPTGTNIWFTNQVARAVKDAYPDEYILIDTFAYTYTLPPPAFIEENGDNVPDGNVIVRMCSIDCCFNHPIRDCGHRRGDYGIFPKMGQKDSDFAEYLIKWGELCDMKGAQIYIWDYTTNYKFYPTIFPNLQVLSANLQLYVEHNVRGVYEQGFSEYTGDSGKNGEFAELRAYILAKCLWDPYVNANRIMDEFMDAYYGAASAPYIKEFIDYYTNKSVATNHLGVFNRPEANAYLDVFECKKMENLWGKAIKNAEGEQLERVLRSNLCFRFYKANMMLREFSWFNPNRLNNNKELFHDGIMMGMDRYSGPCIIPKNTYEWLYRPFDWGSMKSWIEFIDKDELKDRELSLADLEAYRAAHSS